MIHAAPAHIRLSPSGFQWYAKDFYDVYKQAKGGEKFSPARLSNLAQAVELAAKSLHVDQYRNANHLQNVLGHDLVKACDPRILALYGITFTADEDTELQKMSDLHKAKAFQYFWFPWQGSPPESGGITHALTGRPSLPDEVLIEGLLNKLLSPKLKV